MPITVNILENKVLGREYKKAVQTGELKVLRCLINQRFGPIPAWAEDRLTSYSEDELDALTRRTLNAQSLKDLLK